MFALSNANLSAKPKVAANATNNRRALWLLTVAAIAVAQANCFRGGWLDVFINALLLLAIAACAVGLNAIGLNAIGLNAVRPNALNSNAPDEIVTTFDEERSDAQTQSGFVATLLRVAPSLAKISTFHVGFMVLWFFLSVWQIAMLGLALDSMALQFALPSWPPLVVGLLAIAGVVWSLRAPAGWWLQLAVFVVGGCWLISHQLPEIDVFIFQRDACAALLRGVNPYSITFPNLYADNSANYGAGMSVNGRLQFGYVYLPLPLFLALPGFLLGDVRFSHLAAIAIGAVLLAGWRPRAEKALLGALFLWTPVVFYVVFQSWIESFCVLALCAVSFCARRFPRWLPVACGLFVVSKQYALLALPLIWLLTPSYAESDDASSTRRPTGEWKTFAIFLAQTLAVAAIVTLPLALWDFKAFFYSTMTLQFKQPFFPRSLSLMALSNHLGWGRWPWWVPFALSLAVLAWTLRRAPRNEVGFLTSVALLFLVFFAFNKQAFVNYYFFAIGALWCAISALFEREETALNLSRRIRPKTALPDVN